MIALLPHDLTGDPMWGRLLIGVIQIATGIILAVGAIMTLRRK